MATILSVSIEPALLYTRGLVLERTGAIVESATPDLAVSLIGSCVFQLVVLCHSLPWEDANAVCTRARAQRPGSKILALDSPVIVSLRKVEADCRVSLEDGPGILVSTARQMLLLAAEGSAIVEPDGWRIARHGEGRRPDLKAKAGLQ